MYLVIAPTCFSSALLLKADEGDFWIAAGSLMLWAAAVAQGGALFGAAYCIQRVAEKYRWELERVVSELDKVMTRAYADVRDVAKEKSVDLRTAAFVLAIRRVGKAALSRRTIREQISFD